METWTKYTFICDPEGCDALAEYTVKDTYVLNKDVTNVTCLCGQTLSLLSVQDATILPIPTKKEDTNMETTTISETYNPNLLVTYKKIENGETSYITDKVNDIEYALDQSRRNYKSLTEKQNEWYRKESQLRTLLNDVFHDSEDQDTLSQIAEIFDVPLTKEISVTAYVQVQMTVEVDMREGEYDIESLVTNNLTVDSYDSAVSVNNYDVERVEENY